VGRGAAPGAPRPCNSSYPARWPGDAGWVPGGPRSLRWEAPRTPPTPVPQATGVTGLRSRSLPWKGFSNECTLATYGLMSLAGFLSRGHLDIQTETRGWRPIGPTYFERPDCITALMHATLAQVSQSRRAPWARGPANSVITS